MRTHLIHAAGWTWLVVVAVAGISSQCDRPDPAAVVPAQHGPVCPAQLKTR